VQRKDVSKRVAEYSLFGHQGIDVPERFLGADTSPGLAGLAARGMAVVRHLRMALRVEAELPQASPLQRPLEAGNQ
jgi:hypothetical protein